MSRFNLSIKNWKRLVFILCLIPLGLLIWRVLTDRIFGDVINVMIRDVGLWGMRFLLLSLAITPIRKLSGWRFLASFRRMIGLYGFFYICLHLLMYVVLERSSDMAEIWADIVKRPYITFGMASFVVLIPLAATSVNWMIKKMGGRNWQRLHRAVYYAMIAAVVHYYLLAKADKSQPIIYGSILAILLLYRLFGFLRNQWDSRKSAAA
ncbi:MAG: protein-methionine-sulfoxide reductase heme-binding subunit MsrQ [Candidatus Pacebacteria bacterium]|nr:protein-methionine-sulfoxide reductase heme-binding subunit MsrQ [Candidatus Paceibacterota bacterium]